MVLLLVAAQLVVAANPESTYATPALRQLVQRASFANRRVPDSLRTYRARVESEMAFVARQSNGVEQTLTLEQTASVVRWDRTGAFEQRVVGYRSQSVGLTVSAVGLFRHAWAVPVLYGNRITLLLGLEDSTGRRQPLHRRADTTVAVHPFADDRDAVYRFSGGDTIATLNPGGRSIPLVRVHVEPRGERLTRPIAAFRGDIELDEHRAQIVRMRGSFVTVGPPRHLRSRLVASAVAAIASVELENGEFERQFWLPTSQRIEVQAGSSLLGDQRAVFRVVSRFRSLIVNPPELSLSVEARSVTGASVTPSQEDTLRLTEHRLTFAPRDSIDRFREWVHEIGELTGGVRADDFRDVAPDSWRTTGHPIVRVWFHEPGDLFHFNRIEGLYTGLAGEARLRDAAPGVVIRANAGRAWAEQTVRGRISLERQRGRWSPFVRAGRSLDITNDFRQPFDSGSTLSALFSADDYDYVDRRSTLAGLTWLSGRRQDVVLRIEGGVASDRYVAAQRARGPFSRGDSAFRFNRGADEGRYRTVQLQIEIHPGVNAAFLRPGVGAVLQGETATGELSWRRAELRLNGRQALGPLIYAVRVDAGVVTGSSIPPQQLFELGENQNLPGYGYKEFAGNEATVVRGLIMYPFSYWRAPLRVGRWVFPAVAPTVSFGVQSGWTAASNETARSAVLRLGTAGSAVRDRPGAEGVPVSRPTDGVRSSIDFRIRFLGGALSAGVARATDHHQRWRFVVGLAQII